jgi:hypothetical protein
VLKFILLECSSGYALFERKESEEIASMTPEMQEAFQDFSKFRKYLELKGFCPFTSAEEALENINDISEGYFRSTYSHCHFNRHLTCNLLLWMFLFIYLL